MNGRACRTDFKQPSRDGQACHAVGGHELDVENCDATVLWALIEGHLKEAVDRLHRRRKELAMGGLRKNFVERRTKTTQQRAQVAGREYATELLGLFSFSAAPTLPVCLASSYELQPGSLSAARGTQATSIAHYGA